MSASESMPEGYEKYYVPDSSSLALRATIGLILSVFGGGLWLNEITFGEPGAESGTPWVLIVGLVVFAFTLASWFRTSIRENLAGMAAGHAR